MGQVIDIRNMTAREALDLLRHSQNPQTDADREGIQAALAVLRAAHPQKEEKPSRAEQDSPPEGRPTSAS